MSVLLDLSIFPVDQGVSLSRFVAPVVALIRDSGLPYRLTPMGTVVETATLAESLGIIEQAHAALERFGCGRVYATAKFDIREGPTGRLAHKVDSVREQIGEVDA